METMKTIVQKPAIMKHWWGQMGSRRLPRGSSAASSSFSFWFGFCSALLLRLLTSSPFLTGGKFNGAIGNASASNSIADLDWVILTKLCVWNVLMRVGYVNELANEGDSSLWEISQMKTGCHLQTLHLSHNDLLIKCMQISYSVKVAKVKVAKVKVMKCIIMQILARFFIGWLLKLILL